MRDSISLLDQLSSYTSEKITTDDVHDVCGTITPNEICVLLTQIKNKEVKSVFKTIDEYDSKGKNLNKIIDLIIDFLKNTLIYLNSSDFFDNENEKKNYASICELFDEKIMYDMIEILLNANNSKNSNIRLLLELGIIKIFALFNQPVDLKEEQKCIEKYAETKKIETEVVHEKPILDDKEIVKVNKLKDIRINNTLCNFNKADLTKFKKEIDQVKDLLLDTEYSSNVSLILDGELKAKGNNYIIIVYPNDNLMECFNYQLDNIQTIFKKTFNEEYFPIAVSQSEWEIIKKEFNDNLKNNTKTYTFIEEPVIKEKPVKKVKTESTDTEIDNMFNEIIEYN